MKTSSCGLIFATLIIGVVNGNALAATPSPNRADVRAIVGGSTPDVVQYRRADSLDKTSAMSNIAPVQAEAAPADYLEWHGRVATGSALTELMPWTALQQNAN